jgi:hypothetical protein
MRKLPGDSGQDRKELSDFLKAMAARASTETVKKFNDEIFEL